MYDLYAAIFGKYEKRVVLGCKDATEVLVLHLTCVFLLVVLQ